MSELFTFDPDWSDSVKIDHEFKTSIMTARSFREQRFAERVYPRKNVAFQISEQGDSLIEMQQIADVLLQEEFILPEFTRRLDLVATGGASLTEIAVATLPGWIAAGATLVFYDGTNRESAEVLSVDTMTGIATLTAATTHSWFLGGGYVFPGLIGRFKDSSMSISLKTSHVAVMAAEFDVDPGDAHEEDTSAPLTFNGRELWMTKPNWLDPVAADVSGFLETVDFGRGRLSHFTPTIWNKRAFKATYLGKTSDEAEELLAFWHRLKGQQGEFYMPTWQNDFPLTVGATAGSPVFRVPGSTMFDRFGDSAVFKAMVAIYKDGSYEAKVINSVIFDSTNTLFTATTAWSQAVNATTAMRVCWLPVWRSATDTLTMEWRTRVVAQCQFSFGILEDLA